MSTSSINLKVAPQQPQGQEATHDNPVTTKPMDEANGTAPRLTLPPGITGEKLQKLLDMVRELKLSWQFQRIQIVQKILEGYQFFKGEHFFGFYPGSFQMFNSFDQFNTWSGSQTDGGKEAADTSLIRFATNFQQMLAYGYISALSQDVPRSMTSPKNAENLKDKSTAKASTTVQTIIAKANGAKTLHRMKLFQYWVGGCYFEHTRYLVDEERFGTHEAVAATVTKREVMPDRYFCPNCQQATPLAAMKGKDVGVCPNCQAPLSEQYFFEGKTDEIPLFEEKKDVPSGMVTQDIYGGLNVDVKPSARSLRHTPILDLQFEVSLGWLRDAFPAFYDDLQPGMGGEDNTSSYDRLARQIPTTGAANSGAYNTAVQSDPTYSQTWVQPWAFSYLEDKNLAKEFKKAYPKGCKISHVGELVLQIRAASIGKEWTWAGTIKGDYGMYPPPVGEAGISVQKRYNNMCVLIDDYMERCALGLTLINAYYLDAEKMQNMQILPGQLNPIALKNGQSLNDIGNIIHQFTFTMEQKIFEYAQGLKFDMQLLVGVPPQVFGGAGDPHVETKGGQAQQLSTAKGKLQLFWDMIAEQEAKASEQAIYCAGANMTEPWWDTVTDKTKQFRNEYIHPDQMGGDVLVEHDTTQGLPMSPDELREFWDKILNSSDKNLAAMLFKEPKNIQAAIDSFNIPGLIAPGGLAEVKTLWYIDKLMSSEPRMETIDTPNGPQEVECPSIEPNRYLDDLDSIQSTIRAWGDEHFDKMEANPTGSRNLLAFFKLCVEQDVQNKQSLANAAPPPPQGGDGAQAQTVQ